MKERQIQSKINKYFKEMKKNGWMTDPFNPNVLGTVDSDFFGKPKYIIKVLNAMKEAQKEFMTHISYEEYLKLPKEKQSNEDISYYYYKETDNLIKQIKKELSKKTFSNSDIIGLSVNEASDLLYLLDTSETLEILKDRFEYEKFTNGSDI